MKRLLSSLFGVLVSSSAPAFAAEPPLVTTLKEILRSPDLEKASVGVHVRLVEDDSTIFERDGARLLNPASNVKLVTSAAAFYYLGSAFRFRTQVLRDGPIRGGVLQGHLYIKGFGDPSLTNEELFDLVNEIALAGVTRVDGSLIVDATYFDDVFAGPGWDQEYADRSYAPPIGALGVNYGTFSIRVLPGELVGGPARLVVWPDVPSILVSSTVVTRPGGSRSRIWVGTTKRDDSGIEVSVRGAVAAGNPFGEIEYRPANHPTIYAGQTLLRMLEVRGIKVDDGVKIGPVPRANTIPIVIHQSPPLAEILSTLNKFSSNYIAEMVWKSLGADRKGAPGTWAKGSEAISDFLFEIGIPRGTYVLENGSGLNDINRLTPEQLTKILAEMARRPRYSAEYAASLAVAGESGTINSRFDETPAAGRLRAKTGSLTGVSALSGYVTTQDQKLLAFSVMMNGYDGRARKMWKIQDAIGNALAEARMKDVVAKP